MIEFKNINKSFRKNLLFDSMNLELPLDKTTVILGPNGSGKTTLIKMILGINFPNSGEISINGNAINNQIDYKKNFGYMAQFSCIPENQSVRNVLSFMSSLRKNGHKDPLIEQFQMDKEMDKHVKMLSGGTKQKLSALLTFMFDPSFFILDEPTASLDPIASVTLIDRIIEEKKKGKGFLIATHNINDVMEVADRLLLVVHGKVEFNDSVESLMELTKIDKVDRAIATFLKTRV